MTRFSWAAWGLLVVVLDLPLLGWDVLPDLVGYAWLFVIGAACFGGWLAALAASRRPRGRDGLRRRSAGQEGGGQKQRK